MILKTETTGSIQMKEMSLIGDGRIMVTKTIQKPGNVVIIINEIRPLEELERALFDLFSPVSLSDESAEAKILTSSEVIEAFKSTDPEIGNICPTKIGKMLAFFGFKKAKKYIKNRQFTVRAWKVYPK